VDAGGAVDFWGFEAIEGVGGSDGCAGGEEGEEKQGFHAERGKGDEVGEGGGFECGEDLVGGFHVLWTLIGGDTSLFGIPISAVTAAISTS
jgi:hypothetical protein